MANFYVGQNFSSFLEFEKCLSSFENENFVKFYKRDSRKYESAVRSGKTKVVQNTELVYFEIKYCCIKGGAVHVQEERKRKTSSCKTECPAHIYLRASKDGKSLEVKSFADCHNHEISKELFDHLPQQRRLSESEKSKAKELLSLQANKKLLQQKLEKETGKIITLRDLSNLSKELKKSSNNLHEAVSFLQGKYDVDISVLKMHDETFVGMLIQTTLMKNIFEFFPEFMAFDATYKLLNMNLPTFVFLVEDGNCESQIVGIAITTNELKETLNWIIETFKLKNPASVNTKVIMTDKDLTERCVFKTHFENADLLLCIFHSLRTFGREITVEKYSITSSQRLLYLQILQKMVCAPSEDVFNDFRQKFDSVAPENIKQYYYQNWDSIRSEWCRSAQMGKGNFLNCTNNRIESINSKLKSTVQKNSSLVDYVEKLFCVIDSLQNERHHNGVTMLHKNRIINQSNGVLVDYEKLLTPNVFLYIEKEAKIFDEKTYAIHKYDEYFTVESSVGVLKVTPHSCECNFHTSMSLPCRHIFAVRHSVCMPLFDPELVNNRWTKNYFSEYLQKFLNTDASNLVRQKQCNVEISTASKSIKPKSVQAKRRLATAVTNDIVDAISVLNEKDFEQTMNLLREFKNNIMNRKFCLPTAPELLQNLDSSVPVQLQDKNLPALDQYQNMGSLVPDNSVSLIPALEQTGGELQDPTICLREHDYFVLPADVSEKIANNETNSTVNLSDFTTASQPCTSGLNNQNDFTNVSTNVNQTRNNLENIKMPPIIKKRGRPKGHDLTVIGVPKKKKSIINKTLPFVYRTLEEKELILLECFISKERAVTARLRTIEEEEVNVIPQAVSSKVIDKRVDIELIRKYFSEDAWKIVEQVLKLKLQDPKGFCNICSQNFEGSKSMCCDGCLESFHFACLGIKAVPKSKYWMCPKCK